MEKEPITYVLLACCTYKRPNMLCDAINSVKELNLPQSIKVEILVVDNDEEMSAKSVIEKLKQQININLHYVTENNRGLANARNKILSEARNLGASHIFMFDDDEVLTPNSLTEHIDLYNNNQDCLISSGVVLNKFDDDVPKYITKNIVFKQKTTKKTGQIKSTSASGNVFFPTSMLKEHDLWFSDEYLFMGGEDGAFFKEASRLGYTIVQNSNSIIFETVTCARGNLKYVLKRGFYNGFSGSYLKFKETKSNTKILLYLIKLSFVLFINAICILPSLLLGKCIFANILTMSAKTLGKMQGAISNAPLNFYKNVYGN